MTKSWGYLILVVVVLAIPTATTLLLIHFHMDAQLSDFVPRNSDPLYHWRQIYTFSEVGFNGGYYTLSEAPATFTHFYAWGPVFAATYGSIAHFTGWTLYSGVIFDLVLVTASLAVFVYFTRPDWLQLVLLAITVLTFWPLIFYLVMNMQQVFHQSVAILLAGGFYTLIHRHTLKRWQVVAWIVFLLYVSSVRFLWAVVALPFFLLTSQRLTWQRAILAVIQSGLLGAAAFSFYYLTAAAYVDDFVPALLDAFLEGNGFLVWWDHIATNLTDTTKGDIFWTMYRLQIAVSLLYVLGEVIFHAYRKLDNPTARRLALFHILNLGVPFLLTILFYEFAYTRDYRSLVPHLVLSLFVFLATRRYLVVVLVIATNLYITTDGLNVYRGVHRNQFAIDQTALRTFAEETEDVLVYDPDASNAWCNTVLYHTRIPYEMAKIHPGLGVSFFWSDTLEFPPKSKYLVLTTEQHQELDDYLNTTLLWQSEDVNIYLNLDALCE